ncbi:craniofacial development protein 2-like [Anopheles albimanus]|uniref:craniofacial development protein 2-like n=1 Tax=Anopheles albimanus TaxID=7167 RepID=UPI001640EFAB|nr:craniofacial development protein 2-like [Anopheles albimanus]
MRLGSWNVRTLQRAGALNQLDDELAKLNMDLVALQEIRWLGSGVRNRRGSTRYDIYYSCHAEHHILGTGFAVGQRLKSDIIGFRAIDERLCTLRLRGRFSNISLINVHAPTEDKTEEEKDLYYGRLLRAIDQCPKYDVKIILGDFNAKIGRDPVYRQYTGLHSLHEHSNDNGSRLINFAIANDLVIGKAPLVDMNLLLPPSLEETRKAIRRLKNNKAPGTDGIEAELVKYGGATLEQEIHQVIAGVWDSEVMPDDWHAGVIYPIFKKEIS